MNYNVRIDDNFLRGDHVDGEVLQHTDLNELENVAKTAINANYEDIQKLQDGTLSIGNSEKLDGATLSTFATETLQNSDAKVPTSSQVKNYVDGAIGNIDLDGYYTKREIDETLEDYPTFTDYATSSKGGVIKSGYYGLQVNSSTGKVYCDTYNYDTYTSTDNQRFISKGTLENVITGKDLTTKAYVDTELANKVDKVTGKGLSTNDYTNDEKSKLSGIETGAQVNKIETIKVNGNNQTISSKSVNISVPTKLSDLSNDVGAVTVYDIASPSTPGVIKTSNTYKFYTADGEPYAGMLSYSQYLDAEAYAFVSVGTLDNVITGKGLITEEDMPIKEYKDLTQANALNFNTVDAGLYYTTNCYVTIGEDTFIEMDGGSFWYVTEYDLAEPDYGSRYIYDITHGVQEKVIKDGANYERGSAHYFIYADTVQYLLSSYATKNYVDGLVGDIATALDTINGEEV